MVGRRVRGGARMGGEGSAKFPWGEHLRPGVTFVNSTVVTKRMHGIQRAPRARGSRMTDVGRGRLPSVVAGGRA
jgi:hypothetical protein